MENSTTQRYALVTGANKGIGFEICRQLASKGVMVILGSRDETRGIEARHRLNQFHNLIFHQLDVVDPASVAAVVDFIESRFGKLDILVNNAAVSGVHVDGDPSVLGEYIKADLASLVAGEQVNIAGVSETYVDGDVSELQESREAKITSYVAGGKIASILPEANGTVVETLKAAEECIETNYYGIKRLTQALVPLLRQSHSPTIVNVSSLYGTSLFLPNDWAKEELSTQDGLTEDRIDQVVQQFLNSFKESSLEHNHWPLFFAAYKVSKAALNAYTRIVAGKHHSFCINAVCPGYTRTDMTCNSGPLSEAEAAQGPVKLALLSPGGPSGSFFVRQDALAL